MSRTESPTKHFAPTGSFGHMLATTRLARKLTSKECANKAGCSPSFWTAVELGTRGVNPSWVPVMAGVVGLDTAVLSWSWIGTFASPLIPFLMRDVQHGPVLEQMVKQLYAAREHAARVAAAAATAQNVEHVEPL